MANPVLIFPGGPVPQPTPSISALRENAAEWLGLAGVHLAEGEAQAEDGDIDIAIEQLQFAETKIGVARMRLCEARAARRKLGL